MHELSNVDKHRTLHVAGTLLAEYEATFPPTTEALTYESLEVRQTGPIQQDAVLWRVRFSGTSPWPFQGQDVKGHLSMGIAFEQRTPAVGGWIVNATLLNIADRTDRIITRIADELFGIRM